MMTSYDIDRHYQKMTATTEPKKPKSCPLGLKSWIALFLLALICWYNDYFKTNELRIPIKQEQPEPSWVKNSKFHNFFVDTPGIGCRIPYMDPYDADVKRFIFPTQKQICYIQPLFESNFSALHVNLEALDTYKQNTESTEIFCCLAEFKRVDPKDDESDGAVALVESCRLIPNLTKPIFPRGEFYQVQCNNELIPFYVDYFAFVPTKIPVQNPVPSGPNVLIIGIDGVSRLNLHRQLPKTLRYLKMFQPIELLGYNKVGNNTFVNLIPAVTGMSEEEFITACFPLGRTHFDKYNCSYVWQDFKKANYITAIGEDCGRIGLFNFEKMGFKRQPTDYYFTTFNRATEKLIGTQWDINCQQCVGGRLIYNITLDYIKKFTRRMTIDSSKYFGLFWGNSLSHDYLNRPSTGDIEYYRLFKELNDTGSLKDTLVIFMSDHGLRWGGIHKTYQGQMEDRLPFLITIFPEWFKNTYPQAIANFKGNVKRLTTPFDLYETLKDLVDLNKIKRPVRTKSSRGISLFQEIPLTRTCRGAGIKEVWCTCQQESNLTNSIQHSANVLMVADLVVKEMNWRLMGHLECATVALDKVLEAKMFTGNNFLSRSYRIEDYWMLIRVEPGEALYEVEIRVKRDKPKINLKVVEPPVIKRNNPNESNYFSCMNYQNHYLKDYCYCKNLTS